MKDVYRPSHADYTTEAKFGTRNWQGGGRASARRDHWPRCGRCGGAPTARDRGRCGGAGLGVFGRVDRRRGRCRGWSLSMRSKRMQHDARTLRRASTMTDAIEEARRNGDSLGGVVTCVARNVPAGLGEPVFDKLDADLAKAMISLPAAKGFEIGSGFGGTLMTGLQHNDPFEPGPDGAPRTTNQPLGRRPRRYQQRRRHRHACCVQADRNDQLGSEDSRQGQQSCDARSQGPSRSVCAPESSADGRRCAAGWSWRGGRYLHRVGRQVRVADARRAHRGAEWIRTRQAM